MVKQFDIIVIGMGPAGMAVSAMGAAMGLDVLSVEKHKVGGECLNCGCIPSKALLKAGSALHSARDLAKFGFDADLTVKSADPMGVVREKIHRIHDKKFQSAFERATLNPGTAEFVDDRTVQVNGESYTAKHIFIATGTEPFVPPIPGLADVPDILTNTNMFEIEKIPESLTIIGGGAIGSEMSQAFTRLGARVTMAHMDPHLVPPADEEAARVLEEAFAAEGIKVLNGAKITAVEMKGGKIITRTDKGDMTSDRILVAAGRKPALEALKLGNAGIEHTRRGITVDGYMRTSKSHIYAIGDCNGQSLLSHAAMHQGMLALMHALSPLSLPMLKRERYAVPWAVFTEPEIAQVGLTEAQARELDVAEQVVKKEFRSYGRTVADGRPEGFIKVVMDARGRIRGATIVGEAASELIHEWTMAIQYKKKMHHVMLMQHAFPSISMINKMLAEDWMMGKMKAGWIRKLVGMLK
ncbi:MAG: NAD(P)/FAD-dependent oxidoreductase [Synergistota bacterium]|nr:NAD(P)/FAD-dependent oxidoreductase [Synergistota bacterium]